jgi:hypothetical protein
MFPRVPVNRADDDRRDQHVSVVRATVLSRSDRSHDGDRREQHVSVVRAALLYYSGRSRAPGVRATLRRGSQGTRPALAAGQLEPGALEDPRRR